MVETNVKVVKAVRVKKEKVIKEKVIKEKVIKEKKLYVCRFCKQLVNVEDLFEIDGKRSHLKCYEEKEDNRKLWIDLNTYIKEKYFNILVPNFVYTQLRELAKSVELKYVFLCLKALELNLEKNMIGKVFKNDSQKFNYVMVAVKNSINNFVELQKSNDVEKIIEQKELENTIKIIDRSVLKELKREVFDYDILD